MITDEIIDRVASTADIVDVIKDYMTLSQKGHSFIGCCPFHNEKTPSFVVSPGKGKSGIYKCFGCGESGDMFSFVSKFETLSFPQAVETIANKYKIEIPKEPVSVEKQQAMQLREGYFIANDFATRFFVDSFKNSEAEKYMIGRGFTQSDFDSFKIGFSPDSWTSFIDHATKSGYKNDHLHACGLIGRNDDKKSYYDKFKGRVIFPISTPNGQIAGFTGRVLAAADKTAKYLNTSETEFFKKGSLLFGLFQAKKAIVDKGFAILVEGNTDVMRFHQRGLNNTVASCGTAITSDHARLLKRFTENITIVMDGDTAGEKASQKSIEIFLTAGFNVYLAIIPKEEDPDSFGMKNNPNQLAQWLEDNSHDFIVYTTRIAGKRIEENPAEKADLIKKLETLINCIDNSIKRDSYFSQVSRDLGIKKELLKHGFANHDQEDVIGLISNAEAIKYHNVARLFFSKNEAISYITSGHENVIGFDGRLTDASISTLSKITKNLLVVWPEPNTIVGEKEDYNTQLLKSLQASGFSITCKSNEEDESFTHAYLHHLADSTPKLDTDKLQRAVKMGAEYLARMDEATISILTPVVAKYFNMAKADFGKVLKPYQMRKGNAMQQRNENISIDGEILSFDIDRLPDYVDQRFFNKYKHFPAQNKSGQKVFYVFQNENGHLTKVANFYMEPQFQVYHDDSKRNKRVVCLYHSETRESMYIEIPSDMMIEFTQFRKLLWNKGPFIFRNGKAWHLDMILDSIALSFPVCHELEVYGQQHEGFFAFSNAIVYDGTIEYMNNLGLVRFDNRTYYSPSVSCIYKDARKDSDQFAQDRFFTYRPGKVSFEEWGHLVKEVYKYNDNGCWTLIMAILAAFRSDIYPIDKLFTTVFFIGPTDCGKTQLAQSIRALFMQNEAPMFNLNSGTDAAFFTIMERYRNVPVIMEEYNDMQISATKFQGLKAAIYDGEGKAKRKDASSKDLDFSQINGVPILLGQEAPERDDNSLANRSILCPVVKKDDWTDEEINNFKTLKDWEREGLTHILVRILAHRNTVKTHFQKTLRIVTKEVATDLRMRHIPFQTRILNTVSLFLAMVKMFEEHVTDLKLPFTYDEFRKIAIKKLVDQSDSIASSNRVSVFFDTFVALTEDDRNGLKHGREYKVEAVDKLVIRKGRNKENEIELKLEGKPVLFMRLEVIHAKYKTKVGEAEHLKMNNLINYLQDHAAFIGMVKTTTFRWDVEERIDEKGSVISHIRTESKKTSAVAFDYEKLHIDLGIKSYAPIREFLPSEKQTPEKPEPDKQQLSLLMPEPVTDDLPF